MRFVEEIDIHNNKIYLWFMQPTEKKKDEITDVLSWPNASLGNKTNGIFVSAYNWQDLEQLILLCALQWPGANTVILSLESCL